MILLSPVLLGAALLVVVRDGRPVIFRQVRVGVRGRPFVIYKFRTMSRDAEARYEEVAAMSDTAGAAFKMTDDPRITPWVDSFGGRASMSSPNSSMSCAGR